MKITEKDLERAANRLDVEVAIVKAVKEVESGDLGGFVAPDKPTILFEGHIFWNELKKRGLNPDNYVKGNEDILYPKWLKSHYKGGLKEYERLEKAKGINEDAALASASWGMFQIMGFNYAACKENCVNDFVAKMSVSEGEQLMLFVAFLEKAGMVQYLKNKDWAEFAKCYNGPGYAQNNYDKKLEDAYKKYSS